MLTATSFTEPQPNFQTLLRAQTSDALSGYYPLLTGSDFRVLGPDRRIKDSPHFTQSLAFSDRLSSLHLSCLSVPSVLMVQSIRTSYYYLRRWLSRCPPLSRSHCLCVWALFSLALWDSKPFRSSGLGEEDICVMS